MAVLLKRFINNFFDAVTLKTYHVSQVTIHCLIHSKMYAHAMSALKSYLLQFLFRMASLIVLKCLWHYTWFIVPCKENQYQVSYHRL